MIPGDPGDIWSWTSTIGIVIGPTPADRLGIIPADVRVSPIDDEGRFPQIPPEVRNVPVR